ncbi:hypothetical protein SNEBB_005087 [Seison nebaliae]|nr:hypothetical protein SNEBB_005087 [Seison nebaliae]
MREEKNKLKRLQDEAKKNLEEVTAKNLSQISRGCRTLLKYGLEKDEEEDYERSFYFYYRFFHFHSEVTKMCVKIQNRSFVDNIASKDEITSAFDRLKWLKEYFKNEEKEEEKLNVENKEIVNEKEEFIPSDPEIGNETINLINSSKMFEHLKKRLYHNLVIDIRSSYQYNLCHIDLSNDYLVNFNQNNKEIMRMVNIPFELLKDGDVRTMWEIEKRLDESAAVLLRGRKDCDYIFIVDSTSEETETYKKLELALTDYDVFTQQQSRKRIYRLENGFVEWSYFYPQYTNNMVEAHRVTSQKKQFINELPIEDEIISDDTKEIIEEMEKTKEINENEFYEEEKNDVENLEQPVPKPSIPDRTNKPKRIPDRETKPKKKNEIEESKKKIEKFEEKFEEESKKKIEKFEESKKKFDEESKKKIEEIKKMIPDRSSKPKPSKLDECKETELPLNHKMTKSDEKFMKSLENIIGEVIDKSEKEEKNISNSSKILSKINRPIVNIRNSSKKLTRTNIKEELEKFSKYLSLLNQTATASFHQQMSRSCVGSSEGSGGPGSTLGLENVGNTCYINSVLQCLVHSPPISYKICNGRIMNDLKSANKNNPLSSSGEITNSFVNIGRYLLSRIRNDISKCQIRKKEIILSSKRSNQSRNCYLLLADVSEFRQIIRKHSRQFATSQQQDAQEFLIFLLDQLHEDLNKSHGNFNKPKIEDDPKRMSPELMSELEWNDYYKRNTSFIIDYFHGQMRSSITCEKCKKESFRFEPFLTLSLPIESDGGSIGQFLKKFEQEELLDNCWNCPNCKELRSVIKNIRLWRLPPILIIVLKRFDYTNISYEKNQKFVEIPFKILLNDPSEKKNKCFNLYGIVNHSGTLESGHYTCVIKSFIDDHWYEYDDSRVNIKKPSEIISSSAYLLFYLLNEKYDR